MDKVNKTNWGMFVLGMKRLLPITPGVVPFGLIMGTVAANSGLNLFEGMSLNFLVFAGASQLATLELMNNNSPILIVVLTGFVINLRFIMYSASLAPIVKDLSWLKKLGVAYTMTDQSYAVSIVEFEKIKDTKDQIVFYMGTVVMMMLAWHLSTLAGIVFGNFAPKSISLDFAVPLAFMSIVQPLVKNNIFATVAFTSASMSILTYSLPYNLGLILSALTALVVGGYMTKEEGAHE